MNPVIPFLLTSSLWSDLDRPPRLFNQDFGLGLRPEDLYLSRLSTPSLLDFYYRPSIVAELIRQSGGNSGISSISLDKENFKIALDVQQFKPEEIEVNVKNNFVVVNATHEERQDEHGFITRQFIRRYRIPENAITEEIKSTLSSDGVLMIEAPLKPELKDANKKKIKIGYTGKPALKQEDKSDQHQQSEKATPSITSTTTDSPN